ncbi:MAG: right-handed parallel beta-helix repeat-containing protein [Sphingobium sp.]|uniref:right-handed parallel beta-helix repeat-containing protein n=1 Tax=Sphingobium sp. TaxID=1912891 RepID=UPI0029AFEFB6|nr:right-handed parallel beta-helix repeat-containing protein [Sphingobium sp.]MDX3909067.1 right-handed parallel beta-helix repeat-containing protein [Sphingobium sp.]
MDMPTPSIATDTPRTAALKARAVTWLTAHKRASIAGAAAVVLTVIVGLVLLVKDIPHGQSWSIGATQDVPQLSSVDVANLDRRLLELNAGSPDFSAKADAHLELLSTLKLVDGRGDIALDRHLLRFITVMRAKIQTPDASVGYEFAEQAFNLMDDVGLRQRAARKLGVLTVARRIPPPQRVERLFRIWSYMDRSCQKSGSSCDRLTHDFALYFAAHASVNADAQQTAFLLARRIANPRERTTAYSEIGTLMMRQFNLNRSDAGLAAFIDMALKTRQPKLALGAAAAFPMRRAEDRDVMLRAVAETLLDKRNVVDALDAGLAISGTASRDAALLRVVNVGANRGYMHEAQVAEPAITGSETRTMARMLIGVSLVKAGYAAQGMPYLTDIVRSISAMPDGPARQLAAAYGARAMAETGDLKAASSLLDLSTSASEARDDALLAFADVYARTKDAAGMAALADEAQGQLAGELQGRASAIVARGGDFSRADAMVSALSDDRAWLQAAARLALSADMPAAWTATAKSRLEKIFTKEPALWDGIAFADAAFAATSGDLEVAARRLPLVADARLRADVAKRVGIGLVRKGNYDAALALSGQFSANDAADRDAFKAAVSLELGKMGAIRLAAYTVRGMSDVNLRVRTYQTLARSQANTLDRFTALKGESQPLSPDMDPALRPRTEIERYIYATFDVKQQKLGDFIPRLPDSDRFDADYVRANVPQSDDSGVLDIVPLVNNDYNKKFLTARSVQDDWTLVGATIVMAAQGTRHPVYLHLSQGRLSAPQLWEQLVMRGQGNLLARTGRTYTLRAPLFVSEGATLTLSASDVDTMRLSTERASFIVNAGNMHIADTTLVGWTEKTAAPTEMTYESRNDFRPFYIAWSNSTTRAVGTQFLNLGYASGKAYGMTLTYGPVTLLQRNVEQVRPPTGTFVENSFQNMLYGFYSYEANDVQVVGNEYRDNIVYGIDPHDRSHKLLFSFNTVYGSHKKHGIIGSRNVEDSWVIGNLAFDNHGSGIMMDRYAGRNIIYANTAFDNHANGISIYESPCNIISSNAVFKNGRSGVTVRNSWNVGIFHNEITDNGNLGIEGYSIEFVTKPGAPERNLLLDPYERFLSAAAASNTLKNNKQGGMGMIGMGAMLLQDNTLIGSSKRMFLNDLKLAERDIGARQADGVMVGGGCPKPKRPYACPFVQQNFLSRELPLVPAAGRPFPSCSGRTIINAATRQGGQRFAAEVVREDVDADADGQSVGGGL